MQPRRMNAIETPSICPDYRLSVLSPDMSVPFALLGLLDREPSHGYDLKRDYDAYFGRSKPLAFRPGLCHPGPPHP